MDSCPCVLEILDTTGTEQFKGPVHKTMSLFRKSRWTPDNCPCVLEILDTAGTKQLKGQLIIFLGNRGGQLSMRPRYPGHSWDGTVKETVNKTMSLFQEIEVDSCPCILELLDTAETEQLKGQLIKLFLFFRKSRWTAVPAC